VDKLIPVDVYLPGCPPRPEAVFDAIIKLRKRVADDSMQERAKLRQTHRYYSTTHSMTPVAPIVDGKYLSLTSRQAPPPELAAAMGMPVAPVLEGQKEKA
jgi:NAD(P)H-quinone oxidoreductase subunit K